MLSGGSPRTLAGANEVAELVLANPDRLAELYDLLFQDDAIIRMRTADALEKVCRVRPDLFIRYIEQLLTRVASIQQPSVQWHLAQMLGEVELMPEQKHRATTLLNDYLDNNTDWIVLNNTLETLAGFVRADAALKPEFVERLLKLRSCRHKSVARRAEKLLGEFINN